MYHHPNAAVVTISGVFLVALIRPRKLWMGVFPAVPFNPVSTENFQRSNSPGSGFGAAGNCGAGAAATGGGGGTAGATYLISGWAGAGAGVGGLASGAAGGAPGAGVAGGGSF